jgi:murein DD-endopeptidase MepM/ murein hydrolase activator NlpD
MLPWIVAVIAMVAAPAWLIPALAGGGGAPVPAAARAFQHSAARPAPDPARALAGGVGLTPALAAGVGQSLALGGSRVPELRPPVDGSLVRGFEEPAGPFGPGHRGVDFGAAPEAPVHAPARGRVTFAGQVAGTTWVTLEVAPAVLVTLGPLRTLEWSVGQVVATGDRLGTLASGHASPDPSVAALHLGLRVDGVYVDPLPWLAGLARPRLAPLSEPGGPH